VSLRPENQVPSRRVMLPLRDGTAQCLVCWWVDTSGTEARVRARTHTRETAHPTVAALGLAEPPSV
jgi:hypothetical protein